MIPQTFEEWKDCIENKCKIVLTPNYIENRIRELSDDLNSNTLVFIKLYGNEYRNNVLKWFILSQ